MDERNPGKGGDSFRGDAATEVTNFTFTELAGEEARGHPDGEAPSAAETAAGPDPAEVLDGSAAEALPAASAPEPSGRTDGPEQTDAHSAGIDAETDRRKMLGLLSNIGEETRKNAVELREMRRLYHNEYSGRLASLETELERFREIEKGRIYDDILREIGGLYSENASLIDTVENEKTRRQLRNLFLDMEQILERFGARKQESAAGEPRNPRHCRIVERVETDDPARHDTVKESRGAGFYVDRRTLVPEPVVVYVYKAGDADRPAAPDAQEHG